MYRLSKHVPSIPLAAPAEPVVEMGRFCRGGDDGPWSLFVPLHYERNYAYPLLVWLHGPGEDEHQLQRMMPLVSLRNYAAVAPRGSGASASRGFTWPADEPSQRQAEQHVFEAIGAARLRLNVAPRRVFLAGFDAGGEMALRLGLAFPEQFAGVLSVGGRLPRGEAALAHLNRVRRLPVFLAAGRESPTYPLQAVCDDLRLLHTAGMSVDLRIYPGGQELCTAMLADMDRWMMERVTGEKYLTADLTSRD